MLLPLNEPKTSDALWFVNDLIGWLLDYAADLSTSDFDEQSFRTNLERAGLAELIGPRSSIAQHFPTLFRLSQSERKSIRDAFYNDIYFYNYLDSPTYAFRFPSLAPPTQEIGKAFLRLFYGLLTGVDSQDGAKRQHTSIVTRTDIEVEYRAANPEMEQICPACLGRLEKPTYSTSERGKTRRKSLTECEHFFPRSLYPPLIIHPNNLVIICKNCNFEHNNRNPLDESASASSEIGVLRKTFIPYKRSGFVAKRETMQKKDEVTLVFDIVDIKKPFVALVGDSQDVFSQRRVENFNRIYNLSQRWGEEVPGIYDEIKEWIVEQLQEQTLTMQNVKQQLQKLSNTYYKQSHKHYGNYLRSQYVQWILQYSLENFVGAITS